MASNPTVHLRDLDTLITDLTRSIEDTKLMLNILCAFLGALALPLLGMAVYLVSGSPALCPEHIMLIEEVAITVLASAMLWGLSYGSMHHLYRCLDRSSKVQVTEPVYVATLRVLSKGEIRADDFCAICREDFTEPVALPCNHTYCRQCLAASAAYFPHCPHCARKIFTKHVTTWRSLSRGDIVGYRYKHWQTTCLSQAHCWAGPRQLKGRSHLRPTTWLERWTGICRRACWTPGSTGMAD